MLENARITGFADEINSDIRKQLKLLKELGISYLELRSANGKNIAEFTLDEARELKKIFDSNQMKVSAIGSPIGKIQITDEFEPHFNVFKNVVEIAKIMETPYIRIFSFFLPDGEEPDQYQQAVFARIKKMIDYAKEKNVVLLHENEKNIYGEKALQCQKLLENFYGNHFKATFDFANFVQCKQDTMEAFQLLKPYIAYIHIKDALSDDGTVVPAGEGDGNVRNILLKLDEDGFDGFLSLEPHLSEFAGLHTLEKNAAKRNRTDGEAAYTIAYRALMKILKE